jgi:hypothetical protein
VVVLGTHYMLQVKYRKGSMIKLDLLGQTILLYEVPYIDVPTLPDTSRIFNKEMAEIKNTIGDSAQITIE